MRKTVVEYILDPTQRLEKQFAFAFHCLGCNMQYSFNAEWMRQVRMNEHRQSCRSLRTVKFRRSPAKSRKT